jgi:hypothetical protein
MRWLRARLAGVAVGLKSYGCYFRSCYRFARKSLALRQSVSGQSYC